MPVRIAVVGAGIMGSDHARVIAQDTPGAVLQVVCDTSQAAARRAAAFGTGTDIESDALATLRRDDVDAAIIASPDQTHARLTLAAIKLGKPILCEKPLALTSADCLKIVRAECDVGQHLVQVGFMRRFDPGYVKMRLARQSGKLGTPVMMHNLHRNVQAPAGFSGPMAITNSAPHEFDAIRFVLESEVIAISAFEPAREDLETSKPVVMVLETSLGQLVTVEVNNNAVYGYDVRGELVGSEGSLSLRNSTPVTLDQGLRSSTLFAEDWRPRFAEAYRLQNKAWVQSVQQGVPSEAAANAWDGYCATAIAEAGVKALTKGKKIAVSLAEKPDFYADLEAAA